MSRTQAKQRDVVIAALLVGAALLVSARATEAAMRDLPARVLWLRDDLVYVGATDSTALAPQMTLEFARGKKSLGTAKVVRMLDPHLALARLAPGSLAGSLAKERRLERVHVRGEAAALVHTPLVRLGLPGRARVSLLFRCAATGVAEAEGSQEGSKARFAGMDYAADTLRDGTLRLVREPAEALAAPRAVAAPDTILVRFFSDAADQEIALERGELDVAVFWPGELSARMRADVRWRDFTSGLRARGVLAAVLPTRDTLGLPDAALAAMNREAFAGDLLAWRELEPTAAPPPPAPVQWVVDGTIPGARLLLRLLTTGTAPARREARLAWLDVPVTAADAVQSTWRQPGVRPLFALRCPVLVAPRLRPSFAAMGGADAFANLLRCEAAAP